MGLFNNIVDFFASKTDVQATEQTIATNELENSIRDLNNRYHLGHTTFGDYIKSVSYTHLTLPTILRV